MTILMNAIGTCTRCGGRMSADTLGELCPACLTRITFGLSGNGPGAPVTGQEMGRAGTREKQQIIGDYEILEELGRGGMGVVYKARQQSLDRVVALKMILAGHFASSAEIQRFRAEAQNAARLRHRNIVGIYEVGAFEGQHYFSMELVEGGRLSDLVRERPLPARRAAELLRAIAEAVQAGHDQGIVHRDLKPANILIDSLDQPRITDFGLSKQLAGDSDLTLSGHALGSPGYMAPEQAAGRHREVGPRSDVYSLGAVLYHMLAGRPPFQAASIQEILRQVAETEPVSPRLLNPEVPRDLETICLRCLEKEPQRRYASARELAEELDRVLRDEPIRSRPASSPEKVWRWCRRHPSVAGLSLAVVVLGVTIVIGSLWAAVRLEISRETAVREWDRAERTVQDLELRSAERFLEEGDSASAIAILSRMLRDTPTNRIAASWLMDMLARYAYPLPLTPALTGSVLRARFSPDGRALATASGSGVRLWDTQSGKLQVTFLSRNPINDVAFSPDGSKLACAGDDATARILDVITGDELTPPMVHGQPSRDPVFSARFSPDGTRLVTTTRARFARIWSTKTGEPLTAPLMHGDEVNFAEFNADGRRVLTASEDHTAMIWDAQTGRPLVPPLRHDAEVWMARFSPDGSLVATVSRDRTARLWNAGTAEPISEPLRHLDFVEYLDFSPDSRLLATCSYDKTARLWDTRTGAARGTPLRHTGKVNSARFSPDSTKVLTASTDGTARLWSAETGEPLARAISHTLRIWYAEFSPDGERIVTTSTDNTARIWQIKEPPNPVRILQHSSVVFDAEFAPDGKEFVTASYDGKVRIWGTEGKLSPTILEHPKGVLDVQFSPNGRWLASLCRDGQVRVWNTRAGQLQVLPPKQGLGITFAQFDSSSTRLFFGGGGDDAMLWDILADRQIGSPFRGEPREGVGTAALSPDGRTAAGTFAGSSVLLFDTRTSQPFGNPLRDTGNVRQLEFSPGARFLLTFGKEPNARIWNLETRQLHTPALRHNVEIIEARFDRQGNRIVTASADGTARVWDVHTGRPITEPLAHRGKLTAACFSPNGAYVLTGSVDGTARLWDARTGDPMTAPLVHQGEVSAARFSPDGQQVITASRDGTARIWSPPLAPADIPAWFPDFAEAMAGKRVNDILAFEFVPADALEKMKNRLKSLPANEPCAVWARRFFEH